MGPVAPWIIPLPLKMVTCHWPFSTYQGPPFHQVAMTFQGWQNSLVVMLARSPIALGCILSGFMDLCTNNWLGWSSSPSSSDIASSSLLQTGMSLGSGTQYVWRKQQNNRRYLPSLLSQGPLPAEQQDHIFIILFAASVPRGIPLETFLKWFPTDWRLLCLAQWSSQSFNFSIQVCQPAVGHLNVHYTSTLDHKWNSCTHEQRVWVLT